MSSVRDTIIQLQRQINCIAKFCDEVQMQINLDKTKIMVFKKGGELKHCEKWYFKNESIEIVSLYKYLGVYLAPKLSWTENHEYSAKQAYKDIACIFKYQLSFGQFRPKEAFTLFDSMVRPILCYAAELWGYQHNKKVESVHLNFCKRYCSLPQNTANVFVYGECGRLPLCMFYMTQCIKYWLKLLRMDPNRYAYQNAEKSR